jgi:hypothetical protein
MGMIAFDNVSRHELVKYSRNTLDTDETTNETDHHDEASSLLRPFGLLEVVLGFGQHTIQCGKKLWAH